MKKTIIAGALALMASNAIADDFFSSYEKKDSSVQLSAINYSLDTKAGDVKVDEEEIGGRIRYESYDSLNFGYQLSHEGFNYNKNNMDLKLRLSTVGLKYRADIFNTGFYLTPEIGAYHLEGDLEIVEPGLEMDDSETNAYGKVTFGGNIVDNKLDAKIHYTHYNHDSDLIDNHAVGGQINYNFNRDFDLMLHVDKYEDMTMFGIGIAVKYW